ncbi:MAG: restriction endonuclease subunit S [Candidatus Omnitrophota bacterium]|jgi:type I restriction enzyme S subunit|nr:MAG: restriction endonuclease subunit S [Candidatus Omnitrophota bacterium]
MVKPGYKQTEIGVIPEDWEVVMIGDLTDKVGSGITPTGGSKVYKSYGHPFIRSQNVGWGLLKLEDLAYIDEEIHNSFISTEIQKNDVLLNITGASIGRCCIADKRIVQGNVNQHVCIIRTKKYVLDPLFLNLFILSNDGQKQIDSFQAGGNREGLNFAQIRSFKILKPRCIKEQRAIAEALSDVDGLIASLERLIAKKRAIKTAAMQQLLTGKIRLPGFGQGQGYQQTEIGVIPEDWEVKSIKEIADVDPENLSTNTNLKYEFKYISLEDIDNGSIIGFSEQIFFSAPSRARRILRKGDILVSTVRPNLKSHFLFDKDEKDWICSTGFSVLRCKKDKSIPELVFFNLFHYNIERQIESLIAGSNYPAINSKDVKALKVFIPFEINEQRAIAEVLSDMDHEIAALEARRAKTQALKQGMMQELLTGRTRLV